jgi:mono/diheme cytochrome c family protein
MKYLFFLLLPFFLWANSTFITPMEYASQLYENPRGIGCQKCHGENGEGKVIANYTHKNKKKSFIGPKINNVAFGDFYKALNSRKKGMPMYYLTKKEVEALYFYLHKNDKKNKTDAK